MTFLAGPRVFPSREVLDLDALAPRASEIGGDSDEEDEQEEGKAKVKNVDNDADGESQDG